MKCAERLAVLLEEACSRLAGLLEISRVDAGLQTVGWLCDELDEDSAAAAAAKREVDVMPVNRYSRGKAIPEGLQLGFAAVDVEEIRRGAQELAMSLEGALKVLRGQRPMGLIECWISRGFLRSDKECK